MTDPHQTHSVSSEHDLLHRCPQMTTDTDITQCRQVEEDLQESEAFNRHIFESSADCIKVLDLNGCLVSMNAPGRCLMEVEDCTPLVGTAWVEFWQDGDRPTAHQAIQTAKAGGTSRFSGFCPTLKGTPKWWDVVVAPILDSLGKPKQLLVISRDISERKQIEADLRASEARLRFMLDSTQIGEWDLDLTTQPHTAHRSLRHDQIFGYDSLLPEWSYEIFLDHVHPDDHAAVNERFQQTVSARTDWNFECRIIHADHSIHWIWARSSVYCDSEGTPTRLLGVVMDITDRKRTELNAAFLSTVSQDLVGIGSVAEIVQTIGEQLNRYLDTSICAFVEISEEAHQAVINHCWHQADRPSLVGSYSLLEFVTDEFLQAAQAEQAIVIRDVAVDSHIAHPQRYDALKIGAELHIPLIRDGKWTFSLTVFHPVPYNWREDEIELMRELASRVWTKLERARTEQLLRQSEEQSRTILESVNDGFFAIDRHWRFTYVNQAAGILLDRTSQDLIGKNLWEEYPGLRGNELESVYRSAMRDRVAASLTAFYPDHDRWYEVRTYPAPNGIAVYFRNVTEQIQVQAALQEQTKLMRLIVESIGDGLLMANPQGEFVLVNQAAEHIFGSLTNERSCEEWSRTYGLFLPDQQTLFPDQQLPLYRAIKGEDANDVEVFVRRDPSAQGRWVSISGFPVRDMNHEITGGVITCRDITDRKQADAALRESEERFRTLADHMSQFAWMADPNGWLFWYNRRWFEYTGTTLEVMQGWGWQQVHHPEHVDRVVEHFRHCLKTGQPWEDTFPLRGKDGTYRWFLSRAIPIRDAAGHILRWFGTNTDITERLQAEQEREQLLQQEQLARESAEQANRVKDEFLAVLSHELRSPLNPILGWAKLLRGGKLDPARAAEALATIERNAKLQSQLIDDLLDISRIMQGKLTLNATPVSLAFVISSAIETVRLAAEAKGMDIEVYLEPNIGQVYGDAGRLQQVVWNLLSNAVKFTPLKGKVDVRLTQVNHQARLQVIDTGKGIRSEFLPHVFEHFRQEDGATTRKFGGLGLGLAIARQIVELHGGRIWVESLGEGQGATFTVELPFLQTVTPAETVTDPIWVRSDPRPLANLRVLIVDDDRDSREFVAFVVEQAGAKVSAVNSAIEALQQLSTTPFDLLLSDIGMPEMDGYELMRQISQISSELGGFTAIALTAYAGEMNQRQALAAGFQGHLTKPVEPDELIRTIVTMMGRNDDEFCDYP